MVCNLSTSLHSCFNTILCIIIFFNLNSFWSTDENGLRQNRSVTGPGDIWALRGGVRVVIKMNDVGQVIGLGSEKFPRFCSSLVRTSDLCPLMPNDWRCVPNEKKENMWNIIQVRNIFINTFKSFMCYVALNAHG